MDRQTACRICGSQAYRTACTAGGARYVACAGCGVTRQRPYPTEQETRRYYDEYLKIKALGNPLYLSEANWQEYKRIKDLTLQDLGCAAEAFRGKRVLDVGCATGQFVRYAASLGADACGIDISGDMVAEARKMGLNCEVKSLFEVGGCFDFIAMNHVIEHVDDPPAYLAHARGILAEDGFLLVETPCTGAISEAFGAQWRFYIPTEHIHLFSQESLFRVLSRTGFRPRSWVRFGSGNTAGAVPEAQKKAADAAAKKNGTGDTIAVLCVKG